MGVFDFDICATYDLKFRVYSVGSPVLSLIKYKLRPCLPANLIQDQNSRYKLLLPRSQVLLTSLTISPTSHFVWFIVPAHQ